MSKDWVIMMNEKEVNERNRQAILFRDYFNHRREEYRSRLTKFLEMYPFNGVSNDINLHNFEVVVSGADMPQQNAIIQAFQQEKDYWNSLYVINNCNSNIHEHIISTLARMESILTRMGYSYPNNSKLKNNYTNKRNEVKNVGLTTIISNNSYEFNNWGRAGENAVDYVLKWLPNLYYVINKDCKGKYGDNVIILENDTLIHESQEFDHLVIGPQGVFNIETKNYAGKLTIDENGNWFRIKKGETEWVAEENPAQQLFRHHALLQSIVDDDIPIIDVICMAHPNLMINGQRNSLIPVIKKDLLADFIVNYTPVILSKAEIVNVAYKINACKVNVRKGIDSL